MKSLKPYILTVATVAAIVIIKLSLAHFLDISSPILLFFTAVTFSAWFGGGKQGLFASFLTLLCIHFYFVPNSPDPNSFSRLWLLRSLFYFVDCGFIVFICTQLQNQKNKVRVAFEEISKAESDLARVNNSLEDRVAERTLQLSDLVNDSEKAAERLRESQIFLDSVIENIPNMIFVKDAKNLRFVRFNRAGEDLLGQSAKDLIGKNDFDLFPKDEAQFFTSKDRSVLEKKQMLEVFEEPISTPTGLRFLHTKKIPILDKHGVPQYLLGISEDITDKKAVEQQKIDFMQAQVARSEAEKSAARLEFLAEASVNLSKSLDIHFMLTAFSQTITKNIADACLIDFYDESDGSVERIITTFQEHSERPSMDEWSRKNILEPQEGKDVISWVIKSGQPKIINGIDGEALLQTVKNIELSQNLVKNGRASVLVVPLIYHGKVFGTLSLICANPGRTYNELDLSLAQDLARRASFAIENARLFGKANEASLAKSAFLANISHEIRTPLGAMLGFAELALDVKNATSAEQVEYISTIIRNGQQLLHIVDEVLDLSKVESDQILVEKIPFVLEELIADVMSLLMVKAKEKNLGLSVRSIGQLPERITTDPLRLRQILVNIIGNAIKFTEQGHVEVLMDVQFDSDEYFLQFLVKDTGIGISDEQSSRLFQPFVQADSSMTRKYGGTGLGLFLSRKLARLLGGDLILRYSDVQRGSEFEVTINITDGLIFKRDQEVAKQIGSSESAQMNLSPTPVDGCVLIVDDSEDNRVMMAAYLEKSNYNFEMAENGLEGVEKAMEKVYDMILMDIQMPKMDGFEAVRYLRDKNYKGTVVAVTAHAMKGYRERCLSSGFDDYLCKPLSYSALSEVLNKFSAHQ
jgi:two-component system, sensor histidine kinase